jgi:HEAT repeat protein
MRMTDVFVIVGVAMVLTGCGKAYPPTSGGRTASYWAEVLDQPDVELRRKAAAKLGPLVLIDKAAMPALVAALKDPDVQVRSAAVRSLGIYTGARGREILPALREMEEQDAVATVREAAAKAVKRLSKSG